MTGGPWNFSTTPLKKKKAGAQHIKSDSDHNSLHLPSNCYLNECLNYFPFLVSVSPPMQWCWIPTYLHCCGWESLQRSSSSSLCPSLSVSVRWSLLPSYASSSLWAWSPPSSSWVPSMWVACSQHEQPQCFCGFFSNWNWHCCEYLVKIFVLWALWTVNLWRDWVLLPGCWLCFQLWFDPWTVCKRLWGSE